MNAPAEETEATLAAAAEILARADEDEVRALWRDVYAATIQVGGDAGAAERDANEAIDRYRRRFPISSIQVAACKHVFGFDGKCAGCGIDAAYARAVRAAE